MKSISLTAILHELVKDAPSGLPAKFIAARIGRDYNTLMSELSRQPGHKLGADLILPLMQLTGSIQPLDALAAEMGAVCVPLPPAGDGCHPVHRQCMVAVQEFGRLMGATADALEDGTITADERDAIAAKGYEALAAIVALLKAVEQGVERS
ncbi:phage regulatory CII family protein [Bilophila wadsworthia]|uniref:phage regulatory CII family protein n=1 Tax=Bilophila wadsworthia TaxID=35833 RepID=UPI0026650850|nr:phage regulatory CII family protein [Bilophila wadsworthia]